MAEKQNQRMGDVLVELGLIDEHRLRYALEVAQQRGLKLGETLIELAYLREDQVLGILQNLLNIPVLAMEEGLVRKECQLILPPERMRELQVVPLEVKERFARVAFADPMDYVSVENVKFLTNREVAPVLASQVQIADIIRAIEEAGFGQQDLDLSTVTRSTPAMTVHDMKTDNILRLLDEPEYTHLHITVGVPPAVRRAGVFTRSNMPMVTKEFMDDMIHEVLPEGQQHILAEDKEVEYTYHRLGMGRYRFNIYTHNGGEYTMAVRRLVENIPSAAELGLPEGLIGLLEKKGILLVSSPGGHGKDATIAALIDQINSTRSANIITLENPLEYLHHHKLANVNQREIGRDTAADTGRIFEHLLRHDPDVLVLSNLRDMVDSAVMAAQKGILVIVGITATDVFGALEQYLSTISDDYLKAMFARSLLGVFTQRMLQPVGGGRQVRGWELLVGTPRVQTYVRDNKVHYIKGQTTSMQGEYYPLEASLAALLKAGRLERRDLEGEPFINDDILNLMLGR